MALRLSSGGMFATANRMQVRVWRVTRQSRVMVASMKEHKATINCIQARQPSVGLWGLCGYPWGQPPFPPAAKPSRSYGSVHARSLARDGAQAPPGGSHA